MDCICGRAESVHGPDLTHSYQPDTITVLDKGFVRLVDAMPRALGGGDIRIVQAARVSYGPGTRTLREDAALIRYLIRNRHTTPLEKVRFEFHVKLPISCARQWIRHRTGSFNEVSTRYSEVNDGEVYIPPLARFRTQDTKNRQGSSNEPIAHPEEARFWVRLAASASYQAYRKLLDMGVAREVARGVLPLDTYTQWYWTVDLHNLSNFLRLRLDSHAQYEMRCYAAAVLALAEPFAPVAFAALKESLKIGEETP